MRDSKLLKVIKDKKLLPENKLRQALEYKKKLGPEAKLADVMLKLGLIDEKQVSELVAESESIHVIDIGKHSVDFQELTNGVYFCRMISGELTATKRYVVIE